MFALIKREIQDHLACLIGAAVISVLFVINILSIAYSVENENPDIFIPLLISLAFIIALGAAGMGSAQMYTDKNKKISAFLSTLTTTRRRILFARILTGLFAILLLLVPIAIAFQILIRLLVPPVPLLYAGVVRDLFIAGFLLSFACYCLGLQTGWTSNKLTPTLGALGLALILLTLVAIKGFGLHIVVILLAFIVCSLVRTWNRFMSTPLA